MLAPLPQFEEKEKLALWYNKVGPYNNPQETYQYFDLPFCRPEGAPAPASSLLLPLLCRRAADTRCRARCPRQASTASRRRRVWGRSWRVMS